MNGSVRYNSANATSAAGGRLDDFQNQKTSSTSTGAVQAADYYQPFNGASLPSFHTA